MFIKILYFFVFVGLGVAILKYRKNVHEWTGQWYWAEKNLGRGGTILVITIVGLGLIFFGVGYPFWAFDDFNKRPSAMDSASDGLNGGSANQNSPAESSETK